MKNNKFLNEKQIDKRNESKRFQKEDLDFVDK